MSLTELLLFAGSSLKDFNWKYRETVEKRRKENIKKRSIVRLILMEGVSVEAIQQLGSSAGRRRVDQ